MRELNLREREISHRRQFTFNQRGNTWLLSTRQQTLILTVVGNTKCRGGAEVSESVSYTHLDVYKRQS